MAVGLRGIPGVQGGIETHVAELYPRLAALGAEVTVLGRRPFRPTAAPASWRGVALHWLWSPRGAGWEAAVHTLLGVCYAAVRRPDVLHVHAIGPAIAVPLARLAGLRIVFTHHGQDYQREKWGPGARWILKLGERWGMEASHARIAISSSLRDLLQAQFGREVAFIPNGMAPMARSSDASLLRQYGLSPQRYIVQVSRIVPEKRQLDLIAAFASAAPQGWHLVLIGGAQEGGAYARRVQQAAAAQPAVVCTGVLAAAAVNQLLSHAGLFVLPSSHEGLPIALLEAVRLGVPSLASDIPGNREIGLDPSAYFPVGDIAALSAAIRMLSLSPAARAQALAPYARICARYDWDQIAAATLALMRAAV